MVDDPTPIEVDVLVIGEVLVELTSATALIPGAHLTLGVSGDALNAAAAAAAAGARTALLAHIPDDELGDAVVERIEELGVLTHAIVRGPGQHGLYLTHSDPDGNREFVYARRGSFGSTLCPQDVTDRLIDSAAVVTASGVAVAISESSAQAVITAARQARRFVYDPNLRLRLTDARTAREAFALIAPHAEVVKPSYPDETRALLDLETSTSPEDTIAAVQALGAGDVVMTMGSRGAVIVSEGLQHHVPIVPAEQVVDQTGAGDSMTGTICARLALGDDLVDAVRLGAAAASLCVGGIGGTGRVATLEESRAHLATHSITTHQIEGARP